MKHYTSSNYLKYLKIISTVMFCILFEAGFDKFAFATDSKQYTNSVDTSSAKTISLKNQLQDVTYTFDDAKLSSSKNVFQFYRSFVDLFYLVYKKNASNLSTVQSLALINGWCAGDAHLENFGALLRDNRSAIFTMNDIDDAGPCPVILDFYRLIVSTYLNEASASGFNSNSSNINLNKIIEAYANGLKNVKVETPNVIKNIIDKAQLNGFKPNESKVLDEKIIRDEHSVELTLIEKKQILDSLRAKGKTYAPNLKLLDAIATSKQSGGSTGLLRYEVLLNDGGSILLLEFKEIVRPAIYPVSSTLPQMSERITKGIEYTQGATGSSAYYSFATINDKEMLIRPRFSGNLNIKLEKLSKNEINELTIFEAYTLGQIHARSITQPKEFAQLVQKMPISNFVHDAQLMKDYFLTKYNSDLCKAKLK
jgi:hypothetical protein